MKNRIVKIFQMIVSLITKPISTLESNIMINYDIKLIKMMMYVLMFIMASNRIIKTVHLSIIPKVILLVTLGPIALWVFVKIRIALVYILLRLAKQPVKFSDIERIFIPILLLNTLIYFIIYDVPVQLGFELTSMKTIYALLFATIFNYYLYVYQIYCLNLSRKKSIVILLVHIIFSVFIVI